MTQIIAADDAFTEGATNYGSYLGAYLRFNPWQGYGSSGENQTGYLIRNNGLPDLHNAYNGAFGFPSITPACFKNNVTAPTRVFSACLWRAYYAADAKASVAFVPHTMLGTPNSGSFSYVGVCVRASGQTLDNTQNAEKVYDGDSYWFILANSASLGCSWLLLRVNAGVVTVLASTSETRPAWEQMSEIHLSVDDVAGNPTLTATTKLYTSHFAGYPIQLDGTPLTRTVFEYTDSAVGKLTSSGRCGFGSAQEHNQSTIRTNTLIPWFQIYDIGTASIVHRDEFVRTSQHIARALTSDTFNNFGRSVMCGFCGDIHGIFARSLARDSGNNRITVASPGTAQIVSTRPATNLYTQERSCVFNIVTSANATDVGITLRATWAGLGVVALQGYRFVVRNTGSAWTARIVRLRSGASGDTPAGGEVTLVQNTDISSFGLSTGTDFTLSFAVSNYGGTNETNGTPLLVAEINGVSPAWSLASEPGVTIQSDESVLHVNGPSLFLMSGNAQGIVALPGTSATVRFDTWTDVVAAVQEIGEDEMASIVPATEVDGATGTLVFPYDWPVEEERVWRVMDHRFDSRHVARMSWDQSGRRRWRVTANAITGDERDDLKDFYDDHKGPEIPFTWVEPNGETITAHFVDDELALVLKAPDVYSFDFSIEELRD